VDVERRVMLVVALVATAVRAPGVYRQAFWQDEVASARILDESTFTGMLAHVARTESTPPLWYALGWLLRRAGTPILDIRLLSVAARALLAALVVHMARRVLPLPFDRRDGLRHWPKRRRAGGNRASHRPLQARRSARCA
jgi:hypothetical protein